MRFSPPQHCFYSYRPSPLSASHPQHPYLHLAVCAIHGSCLTYSRFSHRSFPQPVYVPPPASFLFLCARSLMRFAIARDKHPISQPVPIWYCFQSYNCWVKCHNFYSLHHGTPPSPAHKYRRPQHTIYPFACPAHGLYAHPQSAQG
jgi:hypothetical protein